MGRDKKLLHSSDIWVKYKFLLDKKLLEPTEYDIYTAYVLQDCDKLYHALGVIRGEIINLEHLIPYPNPATIESINQLFGILEHLPAVKWRNLDNSVTVLLKKLGLPYYWRFSLTILVLTHVLPVPQRSPFFLYTPAMKIPLLYFLPPNSPVIVFQSYFTPDDLATWAKQKSNAMELRKAAAGLPGKFGKNINEKKLAIARQIFMLREYQKMEFHEIAKYIEKNFKNMGIKEADIDRYGETDISRIYNRYKMIVTNSYK